MKKNIFAKSLLAISIFLSGIFTSCQVGLGEAVDLIAPSIDVKTPGSTDSVPQTISITGSANDNIGVTELFVTVEHSTDDTKKAEYKWDGSWKYLENNNWVDYERGSSSGNKKVFTWQLTTYAEGAVSGDTYIITSLVKDAAGNSGKSSKDERIVTVDTQTPVVSIVSPIIMKTYKASALTDSSPYKLKSSSDLQNLINGDFSITGSQVEDTKLKELYVMLDSSTSTSITSYEDERNIENLDHIAIKRIESSTLRNWEIEFKKADLPTEYKTGRHIFRIVTESHDLAGNVERKAHGWFVYDNDADSPWLIADFGDKSFITTNDGNDQTKVYPSCTLQGQSYDDDGIASIFIKISVYDKYTKTWTDRPVIEKDLASENYPTYFNWSVNAIDENKQFKIEAYCLDIYGNKSDTEVRYLGITDVNPPSISITSPETGSTVLGDSSGNFTITGTAEDDGPLKSLKMVRISNTNIEDMLDYWSSDYAGWRSAVNGNKLFSLDLEGPDTPVNGKIKKTFSKTFNLFTDFGISSSEVISTQNLIFLLTDSSGATTVESLSLQGDTEAPFLNISTLTVIDGSSQKEYPLSVQQPDGSYVSSIPTLETFTKTGSTINQKIKLSGTWKDNSTDLWGPSKINHIKVSCGELTNISVTQKDDGTWYTNEFTPPDSTTASIVAEITDWGGNTTKQNEAYYVSASKPELVRISSINSDGSYKAGSKITITLEYNKRVEFKGGTGATLTLNNGGTATYDSSSYSNGTAKHYYTYTVGAGDTAVDKLNVTSISVNSGTYWVDTDQTSIVNPTKLPDVTVANIANSKYNLKVLRSIAIDLTAPAITSVTTSTAAGYYSVGKEILINVKFSEPINIDDISKVSLGFGSKTTDSVTKTSSDTLLFKYKIKPGDTFSPFKLNDNPFATGGNQNITDNAGNALVNPVVSNNLNTAEIYVDTTAPAKPVVSGLTNNSIIYSTDGASFTIDGFETGITNKYSVDGADLVSGTGSWVDYKGPVTISNNGEYTITAYQQDKAGNISATATPVKISIDKGEFLKSITSTKSDGTYTYRYASGSTPAQGDEIPIVLTFRKPVTVTSGAYITLNVTKASGAANATYSGISADKTQVTFKYTVADGDSITGNLLKVSSLEGLRNKIKDENGTDIFQYISNPATNSGNSLEDSRTINIVTGRPYVSSVALGTNDEYLEVVFNTSINKGSGTITIQQDATTYIAPTVLTKAQYTEYNSKNPAFASHYEKGTNGVLMSGTTIGDSDLSEKYILKYSETGSTTEVKALFTNANVKALTISVPVASSNVSINGNKLKIKLSGSYKLPVKGALYTVTIPAGVVIDDLGNQSIADTETRNISPSGVETPTIRIEKKLETIANSSATQPLTAGVKLDCQTPGTSIVYNSVKSNTTTHSVTYNDLYNNLLKNNKIHTMTNNKPTTVTDPKTSGTTGTTFTIGDTNSNTGYKYLIVAKAKKTVNSATVWSDAAYERAYRTIIRLSVSDETKDFRGENGNYGSANVDAKNMKIWLRGGDSESGGVGTPGFPFSWDPSEYSKARLMTNDGTYWYWCSWSINTSAYTGFLLGTVPADAATNGPSVWTWGTNAFAFAKTQYPLYPGESLTYVSGGSDGGWGINRSEGGRWWTNYSFQKKQLQQRLGNNSTNTRNGEYIAPAAN